MASTASMIPKRSVLFTKACRDVVVKTRGVSSSSSSKSPLITQSTSAGGRKSGSELNALREKRRLYAFDWNGVKRTSSTWQHTGRGQPQRSDAKGVLGLLFGVSAIAALAAPVVSWVQEQSDGIVIDVEGKDEGE